jgi:PAS domain S-box-containing protein
MKSNPVSFISSRTFSGKLALLFFITGLSLLVILGISLSRVNQVKQISMDIQTTSLLSSSAGEQTRDKLLEIQEKASSSILTGVLGSTVLVFLLGGGMYWIISDFKKSIERSNDLMFKLTQGEAPKPVVVHEDELGVIIEAANKLSLNMQKASDFAQNIGNGNVDFQFQPIGEHDVIGNSLLHMRNKLKSINEDDKKRSWSSEGLAKFAIIMRQSEGYEALSNTVISELVKYTEANQGGLFIVNRDSDQDIHIQLMASYAFERKKFLEKRIEIGEGLVGQCYQEGETIYLEEIPQRYVTITSGLGGANPSSLLIVPLKVNESVEGIIELAFFHRLSPHEIEFVEKVGEVIASEISKSRISDRTKILLEASQQQALVLKEQEEEMRQNMEEVQATQEELQRHTAEMKVIQKKLEMEKAMFHVLMDFLPDRITYKDKDSVILRVNKAKADRMKMSPEEFLGKTDYDFFDKEHAAKAMREEKAMIESGVPLMNIEERMVFSNTGSVAWASSSRIPFRNEDQEVTGMLIITKDITQLKKIETSLNDTQEMMEYILDLLPVFRYILTPEGAIEDLIESKALENLLVNAVDVKKSLSPEMEKLTKHSENKVVLKTQLDLRGKKEMFRHYLFVDHNRPGFYKAIAIRSENVMINGHSNV